uniref:ATP synthase F0 subunit 6 n=1 Tax=Alectorobius puertoricensis TaxID=48824 RepID=UPI0022388E00|nr:ATP synthase F0 subunit 6 [Alectorobius puertoricensis]UYB78539.1 ATP synthase F0 subunit 6 [Alectorobius puertoricensis]UYB78552.1 ATP synthase F0 subunit 6 [Alectorobius puertoricensis]
MMMNLFSIFDPSTSNNISLNWLSTILILNLIPYSFWLIPSRIHFIWSTITFYLIQELNSLFTKKMKKFIFFYIILFWFILSNNFMGLFPYIFTASSHINLTTLLAIPSWLTLMLYGWINQTNHMFCHLVPSGTPMPLSMFMVLIETISNLIRPITLAVRLSANMISGHLLLCLLSNIMETLPSLFPIIFPFMLILLILEMAVAIIQSYVFITLSSLYLNELN